MVRKHIYRLIALLIAGSLVAGCNFPSSPEDTTPDNPATVAARTLQVVFTNVVSGTKQPVEETAPPLSITEIANLPTSNSNGGCINRAAYLDDITIRDNTKIESGKGFVKIWRLRNEGTCIWNQSYALTFIGGERMSAPAKSPLMHVIQPGQTIDLSIDMTAPKTTGMVQGFWRLQSDNGEFFGIGSNGDQSFWVKIMVISSMTTTPAFVTSESITPSPIPDTEKTPTPTLSPQPTQAIHIQGTTSLTTDQTIDLDNDIISPQTGADLSLTETTPTETSLVPENNAKFSLYPRGARPPTQSECQNMSLNEDPISLTGLAVNDILCYSTDEGRLGYLVITALNAIIDFTFTTWTP